MSVSTHPPTSAHTPASTHTGTPPTHKHMHTHAFIHKYTYMHTHRYTHTQAHAHTPVCTYSSAAGAARQAWHPVKGAEQKPCLHPVSDASEEEQDHTPWKTETGTRNQKEQ